MEYLNHNPNWLKTIIIEIDKFLIDCKYINFFMKIYIQWRKYGGSNSSSQTLIIPRLPCFEKLNFSQFHLYIEAQTMNQCFVCHNCKTTIVVWAAAGKDKVFCILHMLRVHTGFRILSDRNVFYFHIQKMNPFGIHEPCIKIEKSEVLFEQYRMALNRKNMTFRFKMMMQ